MKSDTWINVGAVIGMGTLLLTVMMFQNTSTNARIDDVNARIDGLRSDMLEDHAAIHMRLDGIHVRLDTQQERLSEVAQRLSHVEGRLGMRRGVGGEAPPQG